MGEAVFLLLQSEELINASCFLKVESCDVDIEGGGSLQKRARIWSLDFFISCEQKDWYKLRQEH